jgi:3-hydroxybutyryl-CoA dehydrogenase
VAHSYSFDEIKDRPVAVIGGGTLGKRIAMMFASRGGTSRIHDPNHAQAEAAVEYVAQTLPGVIDKRGSAVWKVLTRTKNPPEQGSTRPK